MSDNVSAIARTSSTSGTLLNRQRSPVRVAAASILSAAFLAPLTLIVPSSGTPPVTRKRSRGIRGGSNSQWNGLASAIGTGPTPAFDVPRAVGARPRGCGAVPAAAPRVRQRGPRPPGSPPRALAQPHGEPPGPAP